MHHSTAKAETILIWDRSQLAFLSAKQEIA